MKNLTLFFLLYFLGFFSFPSQAQTKSESSKPDSLKNVSLSALQFRSIGPAITGGRVRHIRVNPNNKSEYYIASGSGSLWKTTNRGITFSPIFEHQKTYAIGAFEIDPTNTNVLWAGTGENSNHNNSVYGDGIYKSEDGGKSWNTMGLTTSEHIGGIAIDPKNSNTVYVAAMGSLRKEGGERGIFKTTDGGKTWQNVLKISQYTGCYEVHMDPRNPNLLYAVAHQRMRKLYTGIYGGPESGIYKTTDAGATWNKLQNGLPSGDVGRIGMDVSPVNPDVLFAIIDAKKEGGFYKSIDRGASWTKQSSYVSAYTFYFQKIYCDVKDVDRVYSMDVFIQITNDGGKTWKNLGEKNKHVDNHGFWIDPDDNNHLISGCDGGVYETYDLGANWAFRNNIPITEVYKVATDNALPFYNVYIGTQDNNSLGGPSRTISSAGITNQDWFFTLGGDGFQSQVDWADPNTVYAQSQNGGLVRFDKQSGEKLYIKPMDVNDTAYRFDWDSPLLVSKHNHERIYFGGNKLFRSDDRGNTWKIISGDLTRGYPLNFEKWMNRSWSMDEMVNKSSMAQIVSIAESPLDENVLWAGSGDGLIHYTNDGGKSWNLAGSVEGLPAYARIHQIIPSHFDKKVAYAACHNFHDGDYKPYIFKTEDGGKTWKSINGNFPAAGSTYTIAEDFIDKNLLFVGTQFGVYFSNNGGKEWIPLKNGIPTVQVFNLTIQERESDLVVGTFGRGVYILDNYAPLRSLNTETLTQEAFLFPIKEAKMFIPSSPFGYDGIGFMGASFFSVPNPEVGAYFTYYIKDEVKSLKDMRRDLEKKKQKKGEDISFPPYETLKKEGDQPDPFLLFTISDESGNPIRKIKTSLKKGVNQVIWDFRSDTFSPISTIPFDNSIPWNELEKGYMVPPGKYTVSMTKFVDGKFSQLSSPQYFTAVSLNLNTLKAKDNLALEEFNKQVGELTRLVSGAEAFRNELKNKIAYFKKVVFQAPKVPLEMYNTILSLEEKLKSITIELNGDNLRSKYEGGTPTSLRERIETITGSLWSTTSAPTESFITSFDIANKGFSSIFDKLKSLGGEVEKIEQELKEHGAQYTPGRFPNLDNKE